MDYSYKDPLKSIRVALDLWHKAKNLTSNQPLGRDSEEGPTSDGAARHGKAAFSSSGELMLANWLRFTGDFWAAWQKAREPKRFVAGNSILSAGE